LTGARGWGPERRPAAVCVSFDNLGEVTDLQRGLWPEDEPLGRHFSVTRTLPRILALLERLDLRATFFVEGLNAELYPGTLAGLAAAGHEVAYHGWCHETWDELEPGREAELLSRGVDAMAALGIALEGFRPPGGRLGRETLPLLRGRGFRHCSPAGDGVGVQEGVVVLPFAWPLLDAYRYLPRFADLRSRDGGSGDPESPERFDTAVAAALREAVAVRRQLTLVFHPFLAEPKERFAVIERRLEGVRALVNDGSVWCAPHRDVAAWVAESHDGGAAELGALRLDPTVA
jgi:peptidoglycan/xylan/chitin deacetylase (PgdA/CDA1 family)